VNREIKKIINKDSHIQVSSDTILPGCTLAATHMRFVRYRAATSSSSSNVSLFPPAHCWRPFLAAQLSVSMRTC
jgi:hypothetical protein